MDTVNVLLTRTSSGDGSYVNHFIFKDVEDNGVSYAYKRLRGAITDYLETDTGDQSIIDSGYGFCWGDAMNRIPNEFWKSHGIILVDGEDDFVNGERLLITVQNNEVLLKDYGW